MHAEYDDVGMLSPIHTSINRFREMVSPTISYMANRLMATARRGDGEAE